MLFNLSDSDNENSYQHIQSLANSSKRKSAAYAIKYNLFFKANDVYKELNINFMKVKSKLKLIGKPTLEEYDLILFSSNIDKILNSNDINKVTIKDKNDDGVYRTSKTPIDAIKFVPSKFNCNFDNKSSGNNEKTIELSHSDFNLLSLIESIFECFFISLFFPFLSST
ncbi:hypothetical protein K502DRAFT_350950 [Neoconidiobolus thromboides FSU 785]|nr:hypothetical protein K502DRAFT_350950 [Neoconidiobolus thromboides FSU 785]